MPGALAARHIPMVPPLAGWGNGKQVPDEYSLPRPHLGTSTEVANPLSLYEVACELCTVRQAILNEIW
jgi:hypothetical protein